MNRLRVKSAWLLVGVGCLGVWGCKKTASEPTASAVDAGAPSTDAGPADAGLADAGVAAETRTPFIFKDVEISRKEQNVKLTYTLLNQGGRRARATGCLWLHDQDGVFIDYYGLGPLSLRGGESDTFEDSRRIPEHLWTQTRSVQLFAAENCIPSTLYPPRSLKAHLDVKGHPVPPGTPAPQMRKDPEPGAILFALSDVRLSQKTPEDAVVLHFQVKNTSATRAAGSVCARLYDKKDGEADIDQDASDDFNLPAGDHPSFDDELTLNEDKHWDSTVSLKVYTSRFGCSDTVEEAISNVVELDKPENIRAPREEEASTDDSDESGMDESDAYDPAAEFPQHSADTDAAGTDAGE